MERERSFSAGMASAIGGAGAAPELSASAVVLRKSASSGFDAAEHRRVHASERSLNGPYTKSTCDDWRTQASGIVSSGRARFGVSGAAANMEHGVRTNAQLQEPFSAE